MNCLEVDTKMTSIGPKERLVNLVTQSSFSELAKESNENVHEKELVFEEKLKTLVLHIDGLEHLLRTSEELERFYAEQDALATEALAEKNSLLLLQENLINVLYDTLFAHRGANNSPRGKQQNANNLNDEPSLPVLVVDDSQIPEKKHLDNYIDETRRRREIEIYKEQLNLTSTLCIPESSQFAVAISRLHFTFASVRIKVISLLSRLLNLENHPESLSADALLDTIFSIEPNHTVAELMCLAHRLVQCHTMVFYKLNNVRDVINAQYYETLLEQLESLDGRCTMLENCLKSACLSPTLLESIVNELRKVNQVLFSSVISMKIENPAILRVSSTVFASLIFTRLKLFESFLRTLHSDLALIFSDQFAAFLPILQKFAVFYGKSDLSYVEYESMEDRIMDMLNSLDDIVSKSNQDGAVIENIVAELFSCSVSQFCIEFFTSLQNAISSFLTVHTSGPHILSPLTILQSFFSFLAAQYREELIRLRSDRNNLSSTLDNLSTECAQHLRLLSEEKLKSRLLGERSDALKKTMAENSELQEHLQSSLAKLKNQENIVVQMVQEVETLSQENRVLKKEFNDKKNRPEFDILARSHENDSLRISPSLCLPVTVNTEGEYSSKLLWYLQRENERLQSQLIASKYKYLTRRAPQVVKKPEHFDSVIDSVFKVLDTISSIGVVNLADRNEYEKKERRVCQLAIDVNRQLTMPSGCKIHLANIEILGATKGKYELSLSEKDIWYLNEVLSL